MSQENLHARYNCGPMKFSGGDNALYERHLTFDEVILVNDASPHDRFEAVAHSIRDVLTQRWLKTEHTYRERNAKRVYYLSLEFLMGRAPANNITNLMLDPAWGPARSPSLTLWKSSSRNRARGWVNSTPTKKIGPAKPTSTSRRQACSPATARSPNTQIKSGTPNRVR